MALAAEQAVEIEASTTSRCGCCGTWPGRFGTRSTTIPTFSRCGWRRRPCRGHAKRGSQLTWTWAPVVLPSPSRGSCLFLFRRQAPAQQMDPAMQPEARQQMQHRMFRLPLGDWHVAGMGQVFPVVTTRGPDNGEGGELRRTEWYLTQPALMANLESPSRRLVLRTTLNFACAVLAALRGPRSRGECTRRCWTRASICVRSGRCTASWPRTRRSVSVGRSAAIPTTRSPRWNRPSPKMGSKKCRNQRNMSLMRCLSKTLLSSSQGPGK